MHTILTCVLACILAMTTLSGCTNSSSVDTGETVEPAATESEVTPVIQARAGSGDASNAIVVDGTVELVSLKTISTQDAASSETDAATEDEGTTCYALKLSRPTSFSLLYTAAGLHETEVTTDVVLLYLGSHYDAPAAQGTDGGDLFWADLVGTQLSVRGDLWVSDDGIVGLEYPLAADAGRLAQQVGVAPNLLGMAGAEDYQKKGYSWKELSTIAEAMSATQNRTYGFRIANAYRLLSGDNDVKTLNMDDASCTVRLVDVMADVATDGSDDGRYVGMTFVCVDSPLEYPYYLARDPEATSVSWAESDLADWLESEVLDTFPKALRKRITPVRKNCTVVSDAPSVPALEASVCRLWVPSVAELGGATSWSFGNVWLSAADRDASNAVIAMEESKSIDSNYDKRYLYYYRNGVTSDAYENEALALVDAQMGEGYSWWTRTIDPSGYPHYVYTNGTMQYTVSSTEEPLRVVFGFCLG